MNDILKNNNRLTMKLVFLITLLVLASCYDFEPERDPICHYSCRRCSEHHNYKACTVCSSMADLVDGRCICPPGYGMTSEGICEPCHPSCSECALSNRPFHCHSCRDPSATLERALFPCIRIFPPPPECDYYEREVGKCQCPEGYALGRYGTCVECDGTEEECMDCPRHSHVVKSMYGNRCECNDGYYYNDEEMACLRA